MYANSMSPTTMSLRARIFPMPSVRPTLLSTVTCRNLFLREGRRKGHCLRSGVLFKISNNAQGHLFFRLEPEAQPYPTVTLQLS